ncbi:WYL domain-containing protein [Streptomyces sp. NPDC056701]|uniref:WYL domain-containing protein n=1 Tax=unclassified Streptomyces TaxID=2593676 RepID=UPI0036CFA59E
MADAAEAGEEERPGGWRRVLIPIENFTHAEGEILRLRARVEVLSPPGLREQIATAAPGVGGTVRRDIWHGGGPGARPT